MAYHLLDVFVLMPQAADNTWSGCDTSAATLSVGSGETITIPNTATGTLNIDVNNGTLSGSHSGTTNSANIIVTSRVNVINFTGLTFNSANAAYLLGKGRQKKVT